MGALPAMPVKTAHDATLNFDWIARTLPTFVTTLPVQARNGQEIFFQNGVMAAEGVVWHLRYNAASVSAFKWEFVGGAPLVAMQDPATSGEFWETGAANTLGIIKNGVTLTVPLAGDYDGEQRFMNINEGTASLVRAVIVNGGAVSIGAMQGVASQTTYAAGAQGPLSTAERLLNLTVGLTVKTGYINSAKQNVRTFGNYLALRPVRVG